MSYIFLVMDKTKLKWDCLRRKDLRTIGLDCTVYASNGGPFFIYTGKNCVLFAIGEPMHEYGYRLKHINW